MKLPSAASIQEVIETADRKEDHAFASSFRQKFQDDRSLDWSLLQNVFSFTFRPEDPSKPFTAMMVCGDKRSMIPDDLTDDQLSELQATFDSIEEPEYRSRVGDLLWLRKRDAHAAKAAVTAYIASGLHLEDPNTWPPSIERYERALRLARQFDRKGQLPHVVLEHLQSRVIFYDGNDPLYFSLKLLQLLAEFKHGDFHLLSSIAENIADKATTQIDYRRAQSYLLVQSKLLKLDGDKKGAERALIRSAELWVNQAEEREAAGSALAAHSFWEDAITAFRDRPSLRSRIPALQRRLAASGKQTLSEMKTFGHKFDIEVLVRATEASFMGELLDDALCKLAVGSLPIDVNKLRIEAGKFLKEHPLQAIFASSTFDASGRKIAFRPAGGFAPEDKNEAAIESFMDRDAMLQRQLTLAGQIAPAMRIILSEHEIERTTFDAFLSNNQFIPEDRLELFRKGLYSAFEWDFITSLHLLVPQVEHSLRTVLETQGIVPRNVYANGVEEVWSLERVLEHPDTLQFLGEDLQYELQSLLAGRAGPNLRNCMSHGLLPSNSFAGVASFYAWWLIFKLIIFSSPPFAAFMERYEK